VSPFSFANVGCHDENDIEDDGKQVLTGTSNFKVKEFEVL
jgi:hypothetical protein